MAPLYWVAMLVLVWLVLACVMSMVWWMLGVRGYQLKYK